MVGDSRKVCQNGYEVVTFRFIEFKYEKEGLYVKCLLGDKPFFPLHSGGLCYIHRRSQRQHPGTDGDETPPRSSRRENRTFVNPMTDWKRKNKILITCPK